MGSLLLKRVRYFTDGAVIGSKAFVERVFEHNRGHFPEGRKNASSAWRDPGDKVAKDAWRTVGVNGAGSTLLRIINARDIAPFGLARGCSKAESYLHHPANFSQNRLLWSVGGILPPSPYWVFSNQIIIPAPTVSLVFSSMSTKEPVLRFLA